MNILSGQHLQPGSPINEYTFGYFALNTQSELLSPAHRVQALVLSILMGLLTVGIGHLVCKIICEAGKNKYVAIAQALAKALNIRQNPAEALKNGDMSVLMQIGLQMQALSVRQKAEVERQVDSFLPKNHVEVTALTCGGLEIAEKIITQMRPF